MGAGLAVSGVYRPAVIGLVDFFFAQVDHRLYGQNESVPDQHSLATMSVVGYFWVFVQFPTYPVPNQLSYYRVVMFAFAKSCTAKEMSWTRLP